MSDKSEARAWEIIERVGVCMQTTRPSSRLRSRTLHARPERGTYSVWFVTDLKSAKERQIETTPDVGLMFVDSKENAYLSITAEAKVARDPVKAEAIWKATDDLWVGGAG
jgi:general stress protein 26